VFLRPLYRRPVTDKVTAESIIFITWAFYITILFIFQKVIPVLDIAASLNPLTQLYHVRLYIKLLQERGESHWFLPFLKYIKLIPLFILLLMIPGFLKAFELI